MSDGKSGKGPNSPVSVWGKTLTFGPSPLQQLTASLASPAHKVPLVSSYSFAASGLSAKGGTFQSVFPKASIFPLPAQALGTPKSGVVLALGAPGTGALGATAKGSWQTYPMGRVVISRSAFTQWQSAARVEKSLRGWPSAAHVGSPAAKTLLWGSAATVFSHHVSRRNWSRSMAATRSTLALERYIELLPAHKREGEALRIEGAVGSVAAFTALEALEQEQGRSGPSQLGQDVQTQLIKPWEQERVKSLRSLFEVLNAFDPKIAENLSGAWHSYVNPGPAELTKVSTCALEALDRALRAGGPDGEVRAWVDSLEHPDQAYVAENGRPTRTARVAYIMRNSGVTAKNQLALAQLQVECAAKLANALAGRLNAAKHASNGDLESVRTLVIMVEAILMMLFGSN